MIKYLHKLFPSLINDQVKTNQYGRYCFNGAFLILNNRKLKSSRKLKILHYFYLNGINIHLLLQSTGRHQSIYSLNGGDKNLEQYMKVISQDFGYLNNEHEGAYRKPSFWKEINNNNNNNNNEINNDGE